MLEPCIIDCPYCGESIEIVVDASIPSQQYIEDCQVCCRPITLSVDVDQDGEASVRVRRENDA